MKKITSILLSVFLIMAMVAGCATNANNNEEKSQNNAQNNEVANEENQNNEEQEAVTINIVNPAGSPTLSMLKLMKEEPSIGENVTTNYEMVLTTDNLVEKLTSGEADIAVVPTNLAAKLYNRNLEYKLASTVIGGNLFIVSDEEVAGWEDLKGKEITTIGQGMTPDILLRYLMKENGVNPDEDVTIKYMAGSTELAPAYISGNIKTSMMPEPMLSTVKIKKEDTKVVIDLQEEWNKIKGTENGYPQASILIKNELIENNPEVVEKFLNELENSITWLNENPEKAGEYAEELEIGLPKAVVAKSLKGSNISYTSAEDAEKSINEYLQVLMDFSADSIGGKLPDENFYYKK